MRLPHGYQPKRGPGLPRLTAASPTRERESWPKLRRPGGALSGRPDGSWGRRGPASSETWSTGSGPISSGRPDRASSPARTVRRAARSLARSDETATTAPGRARSHGSGSSPLSWRDARASPPEGRSGGSGRRPDGGRCAWCCCESVEGAVGSLHHRADAAEAQMSDLLTDKRSDQEVTAPLGARQAHEGRARRRDRGPVERHRGLEPAVVRPHDARPAAVCPPAQDVDLVVADVAVLARYHRPAAGSPIEPWGFRWPSEKISGRPPSPRYWRGDSRRTLPFSERGSCADSSSPASPVAK
jgi:hypothetical protein